MGSQTPSERIAPRYKTSDGNDACQLLTVGGLILDPWQSDILNDWMGRNAKAKWTAPTCGGSVPRQNGKTALLQGRMLAGMLMYNEQVIYTAHLQKTATETFEEMRAFCETKEIAKYVSEIKTALGREQIIFRNGARVKFLARTRNGGRGQHGDLLIFDEAQSLDETQQASFLPAISASLNPQTIYVGTPPDDVAEGLVFRGIREKALKKESRKTAWFEFSVKEIGDVTDQTRWADANPALGRRILTTTIESECEQMDADTFARERLGWWTPIAAETIEYAIDKKAWEKCASDDKKPEGRTAYGIKFSADGEEVLLCGAVCPADGKARISIIDRQSTSLGLRWLSDWLNKRYSKACCVVIDGRNSADVLIDRITPVWKMKGAVIRATPHNVTAADALLMNEINEATITYYRPQEALTESATTSTKRSLAGGWAFGGADSTPIEACALALWGCRNSKRDPTRKMRIG